MPNANDVSSNMIAALRASEPDLDTSVGTPIRKILDAVAESIAESYADQHLINYQYDVDSKSGGDLDTFCALFGIVRIPAQRSQGIVTFTRPDDNYAATTISVVPPTTQVVALVNPNVYVQTTVSAILDVGQTSVDIPVQAVNAGSSGNVAAGLLYTIASSVSGVTQCINTEPMTNGADQETDDQLRTRFKQVVFRSMAGTQAMYQGIALSTPSDPTIPNAFAVSQANILGASKRYREQIQVISGTATSTVTNAAYVYADNLFCGPDIDAGSILQPGVDYSFTPSNPTDRSNASVVISSLNANMPDGLYDLDFEYVPQASRNDPANTRFASGGVNNRIDLWCNGSIPTIATQAMVFSNAIKFNSTAGNQFNQNYYRTSNPTVPIPAVNAIFLPLVYGPVLSLPTTLTINSVVYNYGTDYWIVSRDDAFGSAPNSIRGILWTTNVSRIPPNNSSFTLNYTYNAVAYRVADALAQWRMLGTDAWVHAGKQVPIQFNLAVVFDRRFDPTAVTTNINNALSAMVTSLGFDAALQVSDVLTVVHNVPGVDNARFLTSTDNGVNYAMQRMSLYVANTVVSTYATAGRARDVQFADDQYPVFYASNISQRATNSFSTGA